MFFIKFCSDLMFMCIISFTGVVVFCSFRKHMLLTLLSLEYLVLCIYMYLVMYTYMYMDDCYMILIFLSFSVCEGVLGLSVLVTLIRCHGNDQVNLLFMMKW